MGDTIDILGVKIDKITMSQAVDKVEEFLGQDCAHSVYTPNAEIMFDAAKSSELRNLLNSGSMVVADGAGVILAAKILSKKLPEKVSGIDLVKNLFINFQGKGIKFYFLGSKPGIAEQASECILKQYPGLIISGYRDGYFSEDDEDKVIDDINSSGTDILLVALGAPKQEIWIHNNLDKLKVKVCIGVGGSLDVFAGKASLAPEFMRKNSLEWLYRLYKEPWRYKRMLKLPKFIARVAASKFSGSKSSSL